MKLHFLKKLIRLGLLMVLLHLGAGTGWAVPREARVKSVKGQVEYAAPGSQKFESLKADMKLAIGSQVKTGADGEAIIVAVPGAAIRLSASTHIILGPNDFAKNGDKVTSRKALVDLKSGTVSALINHNERDVTDFQIKTPQGVAAARGTFYAVTVENGKAAIAVKEGKVGMRKFKAKAGKAATSKS